MEIYLKLCQILEMRVRKHSFQCIFLDISLIVSFSIPLAILFCSFPLSSIATITNAQLKMECKLTATHDYFADRTWDAKFKFANEYDFIFETELDFSRTNYEYIGATTYADLINPRKALITVYNRGFFGMGRTPNPKLTQIFDDKMQARIYAIRHGRDPKYRVSYIGFNEIDKLSLEQWQHIYTALTGWDNPPLSAHELIREREELLPNFVSFYRAEYNRYFNEGILTLVVPSNFQFFERVTLWVSGCSGAVLDHQGNPIPINAHYLQLPADFF